MLILELLFMLFLNTPCETESSMNCHWAAQIQGNGQGTSFIDFMGITIELGGSK